MLLSTIIFLDQQQVNVFCDSHGDKPIQKICIDENCISPPLLCSECLINSKNHINQCHRNIFDLNEGLPRLAQKIENVAPQSIFSKYFSYFREFQGKQTEWIDSFTSFIKQQKQKISDDIENVRVCFMNSIDNLKMTLLSNLDDQIQQYVQNYDTLKNMFNDGYGAKYKQLIRYSDLKVLYKRLNQLNLSSKASELIKQIKSDQALFQTSQSNEQYEALSYRMQELFLILNSQSISPPTYQSQIFMSQVLGQVQGLTEQLTRKILGIFERNIHHYPITNFTRIQQQTRQELVIQQPLYKLQDSIITSQNNYAVEQCDTNFIELPEEEACVTALVVLDDKLLIYALSDSTVRFRCLSDCARDEYEPLQLKTLVYAMEAYDTGTIALGCEDCVVVYKVDTTLNQVRLRQICEYRSDEMFKCTSLMNCQDVSILVAGDWEGQLFAFTGGLCVWKGETQTQVIVGLCRLSNMDCTVRFVSASKCDMELGGVVVWQFTQGRTDFQIERRIRVSQVRRMIVLQQQVDMIVLADERNKIIIWDTQKNMRVKEFSGGESPVLDIIAIEQKSSVSGVALGLLNSQSLRFIDQHDQVMSIYSIEDFPCQLCRAQFLSSKLISYGCEQQQFNLAFPKHLHFCRHESSENEEKCQIKSCFYLQKIKLLS